MSSLSRRSFADLLTFSRNSVGTYVTAAGVLASAAVDVARVDYDPATLAVRGLLIEEARTNLLSRSQEFSNAGWTKTQASVTADVAIAPDGATTADKLYDDSTASAEHYVQKSYTKTASSEVQYYALSVWAKSAERTRFRLYAYGTSGTANGARCDFNLGTGTASAVTVAGAWDNGVATIEAYPNGWYRCAIRFRVNNDAQAAVLSNVYLANSGGNTTYSGDGTSGLYLWGAQLEKGAFPTSYIVTTTTTGTRSRDILQLAAVEDWIADAPGTLLVEASVPYSQATDTAFRRLAQIDDASTSSILLYVSAGVAYGAMTTGGVTQLDLSSGSFANGTVRRTAIAWSTDDVSVGLTGNSLVNDTLADMPTDLSRLYIGCGSTSGQELCGHIRKVKFWPRRLSTAELTAAVA